MILIEHHASCPMCRRRLKREAELREIREHAGADEVSGSVAYTCMSSPLGTLWIAANLRGLVSVSFAVDEATFCHWLENAGYGIPAYQPDALAEISIQFAEYFAGRRRDFDLPIDLRGSTPFRRAVLAATRQIPYGEVQSYGQVASAAGRPGAARAVGTSMAANPVAIVVPCHRVVRSDGLPGEYGRSSLGDCGTIYKNALLALEREAVATST